jgi:hypothetical protein
MCSRSPRQYEVYGLEKLWLEKDEDDDAWEWAPGHGTWVEDIKNSLSDAIYVDENGAEKAFAANIAFCTWEQWEVAEKYGEVDVQTEATLRLKHAGRPDSEEGDDAGDEEENNDVVGVDADVHVHVHHVDQGRALGTSCTIL